MWFLPPQRQKLMTSKKCGCNNFQLLLLFTAPSWGLLASDPLKEVPWLAPDGAAKLLQDICAVHLATLVKQPPECRVAHAGFLCQSAKGQALAPDDFRQHAFDHGPILVSSSLECQGYHICKIMFTPKGFGASLSTWAGCSRFGDNRCGL